MSNIYPPSSNELQVIEYPGRVENVEKMLDTLGGITKISQVFSGDQKRLELRYHPKNPYSKGILGELTKNYGLLLAIKVRRYKNNKRPPEFNVRILGHCKQLHVFSNLCDFQYLPFCKEPSTNKLIDALKVIAPKSVNDAAYFSQKNAPLFTSPTVFARTSALPTVTTGIFRYDGTEDEMHPFLETTSKPATDTTDIISFSLTEPLPTQPDPRVLKRTKSKVFLDDAGCQRIKQLFDECPIWTRVALLYESKVSNDKFKNVVPSLAFFYTSGPWRSMYVRYGYDPRKDFKSRHFQTFDFRIRFRTGVSEFVSVSAVRKKQQTKDEEGKAGDWSQDINYPYFNEHKLPRARQCIMRFCDLHVPKVQEMLDKIPSPLTGAVCNEKTGWLPPGFDSQVRQIVSSSVKEILRLHNQKSDNENEEYDDDEMDIDSQTDEENLEETLEDMQIE